MADTLEGRTVHEGAAASRPVLPDGEPPRDELTYGWQENTWQAVNPITVNLNPGGRLSFSVNDPAGTTTGMQITGAVDGAGDMLDRVYYLPYLTPVIPLFNGTSWERHLLTGPLTNVYTDTSENPTLGPNQCIDLFVWNSGGTLKLVRGVGWALNGSNRNAVSPLTQIGRFKVNGAAIPNGPAQARGTWVGTIGTWDNSRSYYRLNMTDPYIINHVWNAYNRRKVAGRVNPPFQIPALPDSWAFTYCSLWIVSGDRTALRIQAGCQPNTIDQHIAIVSSNFNFGGEDAPWAGAGSRALLRARWMGPDPHCTGTTSVAFGPGLGDFRLFDHGVARSFNALMSPISGFWDA